MTFVSILAVKFFRSRVVCCVLPRVLEPKTGTGMMHSWALGILLRTCELLNATFGTESCSVDPMSGHTTDSMGVRTAVHSRTLTFEPRLSPEYGDAKCSCDDVDR